MERTVQSSPRTDTGLLLVVGLYVGGLVTANAIAAKLITIGGFVFTAGAIAYPMTFILQDVLSERWGQQVSRAAVLASFAAALSLVAFTWGVMFFEATDPVVGEAYRTMFAITPRVVLASLTAFVLGGLVDVAVFFAVRRATGAPHLWLRKVVSTTVSQAVDSVLFVAIAFGGALPVGALASMALGQYLFKQACAIGGLPVSYGVLRLVR